MADAKRCDKCGKCYSNKDHECHLSYHDFPYYEKFYEDPEYMIPITVTFRKNCSIYYTLELCPDCMRNLIHFITKEEPDGNSSKDN